MKVVTLRVPEEEFKAWQACAKKVGATFSWWARDALHRARMEQIPPTKTVPDLTIEERAFRPCPLTPGCKYENGHTASCRAELTPAQKKVTSLANPAPKKTKREPAAKGGDLCPHRNPVGSYCRKCVDG